MVILLHKDSDTVVLCRYFSTVFEGTSASEPCQADLFPSYDLEQHFGQRNSGVVPPVLCVSLYLHVQCARIYRFESGSIADAKRSPEKAPVSFMSDRHQVLLCQERELTLLHPNVPITVTSDFRSDNSGRGSAGRRCRSRRGSPPRRFHRFVVLFSKAIVAPNRFVVFIVLDTETAEQPLHRFAEVRGQQCVQYEIDTAMRSAEALGDVLVVFEVLVVRHVGVREVCEGLCYGVWEFQNNEETDDGKQHQVGPNLVMGCFW